MSIAPSEEKIPTGASKSLPAMTVPPTPPSAPPSQELPKLRFAYLDGIRGFAALYVALFHCYQMQLLVSSDLDPARAWLFFILKPLCMGHYAVAVFIVLSGYCLMLPIARVGGSYKLKDGPVNYFHRRARRILPPFYASVLLTLALLPATRVAWDAIHASGRPQLLSLLGVPDKSAYLSQFLSHLALTNNGIPWNNEALVKFPSNSPLWSVATEWQIYFLFPALLLPILRRFGSWISMSAGIGVGAALTFAFDGRYSLACPWMLGVFAIGMFGALISCSPEPIYGKLRKQVPWGWLSVFILTAFLVLGTVKLGLFRRNPVIVDTILGMGIMCGLVAMSRVSANQGALFGKLCVNILSSRIARLLGGFSYSLYLIHYPLIVLAQACLIRAMHSLLVVDFIMLLPVMGAIIGAAYLFSQMFERPFMRVVEK